MLQFRYGISDHQHSSPLTVQVGSRAKIAKTKGHIVCCMKGQSIFNALCPRKYEIRPFIMLQIKKAGGGDWGEGATPPPKAEWQYQTIFVLPCAVEYGTQGFCVCIYIWYSRYIYIYICAMHNMPVVSECKLNQVDIVGEPLSTSVQCPAIPLSASFLPSLSQYSFFDPDNICLILIIIIWSYVIIFYWCVSRQ